MQKLKLLFGPVMAIAVIGAALFAAEITVWLMSSTEYHIHKPQQAFVLHPLEAGLQGASETVRVTFNAQGIRGGEVPKGDALRILALGGSTTIQYFLDDDATWPARLRRDLLAVNDRQEVWIGNAGRAGLGAAESYLQLEHLYKQMDDIDIVLMLIGAIDAERALLAPKKVRMSETTMLNRAFAVQKRGPLLSPLNPNSHVRRKLRRLYWKLQGTEISFPSGDNPIIFQTDEFSSERRASEIIDEVPNLNDPLQLYAERLSALTNLAEQHGTRIVFITQPTMYSDNMSAAEEKKVTAGRLRGKTNPDGTAPYYSVRALHETLNRFQDVLLNVCEERNLLCIDLDSKLPKEQAYFIDHIHFSEEGARQAAKIIAAELIDSDRPDGD